MPLIQARPAQPASATAPPANAKTAAPPAPPRPPAVAAAPPPAPVARPAPPPPPMPPPPVPVPATTALALPAAPDEQLPAYVEVVETGFAPGLENAADAGLSLPMLCVEQFNPPTGRPKVLAPGDVFLTSDANVAVLAPGQEAAFVPFLHFPEWIEWRHRNLGGGMVDRSRDPRGELAKRSLRELAARGATPPTAEQQPTSVVGYHVFLVLFEGGGADPVAIPLSRTKFKKGKALLALAMKRRSNGKAVPLYGGKYTVKSVLEQNAKGQYYNFEFVPAGAPTAEEYQMAKAGYLAAKELYDAVRLDYEAEEPDDVSTPAAPKAGAGY